MSIPGPHVFLTPLATILSGARNGAGVSGPDVIREPHLNANVRMSAGLRQQGEIGDSEGKKIPTSSKVGEFDDRFRQIHPRSGLGSSQRL